MADFSFVDGNVPTATTWNSNVRDQTHTICTSSTRPSAPVTGRLIYETDTLKELIYDGSSWVELGKLNAWTAYTPTWTGAGGNPSIGNGSITGRYHRLFGRTYLIEAYISAGSTTTFGTGLYSISCPASITGASNSVGTVYLYDASASLGYPGIAFCNAATTITLLGVNALADNRLAGFTPTVPVTLATSDYFVISIIVESTS